MTQTSDSRPAAGQRRPGKRAGGRVRDTAPAAELPVAKVAVDIPLAHLDRPFDYLVPERMAADVVPGCRVRVRFSGKLVDGFVLERIAQSEHQGRLSYLDRVVSAEPVLTPELAGLARAVADIADRARSGNLKPDELSGGTFTITNIGSQGALFDTPILVPPQAAMLGTGAIVKRPRVVVDDSGNESIGVRSICYLPLTYDHRLIDGADAGRFLTTIKHRLEEGAFEADLGL